MNCPYCNAKLFRNKFEDLVCPIDGIIRKHKAKEKDKGEDKKDVRD